MTDRTQIFSFFPTTILVSHFILTEKLVSFLNSLPMNVRFEDNRNNEHTFRKKYGTHTQDIYILKNNECSELREHILKTALSYSNDILGYKCQGLEDTISWLSIKAPGEEHIPHTHPNSFISGVFYYEDVPKETPLIFKKPKIGVNTFEMIPPFDRARAANIDTAMDEVGLWPTKGSIVFFPSHLEHFVPINSSGESRGGLAFNLMPTKNLGEEEHLTMFRYNNTLHQC